MRIRIKDKNRIPQAIKKVEDLNGSKINAGVLGEGEQQMIAGVHEYGIQINVTPKMRGFLASKGLHLKKSTTHITIPERSFIRSGWDAHEKEVLDKSDQMIPDLIAKGLSVETFLEALGQESRDLLRDYARDLRNPANHPFTIDQKGSSNPLVDSGGMIGAITYEIL
ncbi:hypothetical protein ABE28_008970 [Peribacillus muralis]|uniref:Uncharacterized protein n=1 Tax=Peribacillus muralis TaxID=264697 RepID=A0A1B3XMQ7_9BACI|nr:hypothetical protein [Peribacillus muralis]AOH54483.1 hypothetical protein ABE28_008970 [Peribacillus muralis]